MQRESLSSLVLKLGGIKEPRAESTYTNCLEKI